MNFFVRVTWSLSEFSFLGHGTLAHFLYNFINNQPNLQPHHIAENRTQDIMGRVQTILPTNLVPRFLSYSSSRQMSRTGPWERDCTLVLYLRKRSYK